MAAAGLSLSVNINIQANTMRTIYISFIALLMAAGPLRAQYTGGPGDGFSAGATDRNLNIRPGSSIQATALQAFPNPARSGSIIQLSGYRSQLDGALQITDAAGKLLVVQTDGGSNAVLPLALPAGVYILSCEKSARFGRLIIIGE